MVVYLLRKKTFKVIFICTLCKTTVVHAFRWNCICHLLQERSTYVDFFLAFEWLCWSVYVNCTNPFHQFGFLVALASAWSLTWYQSLRSRVQVLAFAIYCKNCCYPSVSVYRITYDIGPRTRPLVPTSESLHVVTCPSHVSGGVEVYMWIVLALSISSDFWLCWLVHEA
jgi:hypothetical protein